MATINTMNRCTVLLKTLTLAVILFGGCAVCADSVADDKYNSSSQGSDSNAGEDLSPLEKGTQPLFFVTNFFLNSILQPNTSGIPIDLSKVFKNGTIDFGGALTLAEKEWSKYVMHYLGFLICFALGIIFIIVMPLVGLCFFCCRLCGRCGAKPNPMDSKYAKCKRVTFGTFLFIVTTFMLAATVCAFVTNDLIHKQASDEQNGFIGSVSKNIEGVETYIRGTAKEIKTTVLSKFDDTKVKIINEVKTISTQVQNDIGDITQAGPLLDNATKLALDVTTLRKGLEETKQLTLKLKTEAGTLTTDLSDVRTDVNAALSSCTVQLCTTVKSKTVDLKVNIDFTKVDTALANVQSVIDKLKVIESKDIIGSIKKGKEDYNQISANISKSIQRYINDSEAAINGIKGDIEKDLTKMSDMLTDSTGDLEKARVAVKRYQPEIKKYGDYVMYGGIGLSCVLLLIVLLNYLGLMFGACGERPYEDARACNKGIGANFLMAGVGFTLIFCWLLMLMTTILFIIGGPTETEVCRHLVNPINSSQIEQLDDFLNLGQFVFKGKNTKLNVQDVLRQCSEDAAIYSALKLENLYNASKLIEDAMKTVDTEVLKVAAQIEQVTIDKVVLLPQEAKDQLDNVVSSQYDTINFQNSLAELTKALLGLKLADYIIVLKQVKSSPKVDQAKLQTSIDKLTALNTGLVKTMQTDIDKLTTQMTELSAANIQTNAGALKSGLGTAETRINTEFPALIKKAANSTAITIMQNARVFGNQLIYELETNIGKCKSLYDSLMGIINTTCKKTLAPFNGFWFAFGWCLFFFIPSLIFSVKLAGLYRRTEKYSAKEFDEAVCDDISPDPRVQMAAPVTPVEQRRSWGKLTKRHEKEYERQKDVSNSSDANNYHGIYPGDNIPLNEMRNNPKHYRDGRGLQNSGYEQDSNGPSRSDQRNGNPPHNPEYPDHRGGYGDGGSPREGQGYPDDYHPHSRPPSYSAPSPPHWQKVPNSHGVLRNDHTTHRFPQNKVDPAPQAKIPSSPVNSAWE